MHFTLIMAENNRFGSFLHAQYNIIFDMLWFISRKLFNLLFYREVSSESKLICGLFTYVKSYESTKIVFFFNPIMLSVEKKKMIKHTLKILKCLL